MAFVSLGSTGVASRLSVPSLHLLTSNDDSSDSGRRRHFRPRSGAGIQFLFGSTSLPTGSISAVNDGRRIAIDKLGPSYPLCSDAYQCCSSWTSGSTKHQFVSGCQSTLERGSPWNSSTHLRDDLVTLQSFHVLLDREPLAGVACPSHCESAWTTCASNADLNLNSISRDVTGDDKYGPRPWPRDSVFVEPTKRMDLSPPPSRLRLSQPKCTTTSQLFHPRLSSTDDVVPYALPDVNVTSASDVGEVTAKDDRDDRETSRDHPAPCTLAPSRRQGDGSFPLRASSKVRRQVRFLFERAKQAERDGSLGGSRALLLQCLELDRRDAHSWLALARLEARGEGVSLKFSGSSELSATPDSENSFAGDECASRPATPNGESVACAGLNRLLGLPDEAVPRGTSLARQVFAKGVQECPTNVHLLQAWAVLEHRCGDRDAARKLFAQGLALEPDNPYVCQAWGLLEQRVGNTEEARLLFRRSVNLRPHPEVCSAWAVLEAREGHVVRARELFQAGLRACKSTYSPPAAAIYRSWAEVEERVGDMVGARELLAKAVASQPRVCEAYVALSRLESRRGYTSRALELMHTAAGLSPNPPAVVFNSWAQIEWAACGRTDEARRILERGHRQHPSDPSILQSLGTLEEKCGDVQKAKRLYAESIRLRPTAPAFVAWALAEEREGDFKEAVNLFEQALLTDPLHGAAYNAYGMMEARQGNLDRARAIYERGLKVYASPSVYHGFGQLELKLGRDPDRARELFRCGVAQTREDTSFIWHSWGMLELRLRKPSTARGVFQDALSRYPRNSRVLLGAALAHCPAGPGVLADERAARALFKRAVAADPTHAHAWQAWGVFELRQGRRDAAKALFRRGLRMCPTHGALWQAWGVLETSNDNFERARQLFRRGAAACPSHVHLLQAWACMEVRCGYIDRARELLDSALEVDPRNGPVWTAYGLLEARHGTIARARQHFVTGIDRAADHAPLYRAYGQTEARAGNHARARELFREGLRRDPWHAPLYHAFAEFEAMVGNLAALGELNKQAEKYFGSEADATHAIHSGEESLNSSVDAVDGVDTEYTSKSTPMELALDNV
jgi:tetratricopeptide (TPR) repeat protein